MQQIKKMHDTVLKIIAILTVSVGLLVLWYFFRKWERRNNVLTVDEATLGWKEFKKQGSAISSSDLPLGWSAYRNKVQDE